MAPNPAFGLPCRSSNMVQLRRRDGLSIPLHKDIAPLVAVLMDLTEMLGYDIKPGWTWGYACRDISGTNTKSNHSWGCAVDINAPVNPYASAAWHRANYSSRPFGLYRRTDIPQNIFELWENHGFRLGVKYESKPDPMHFEFVESVAAARTYTTKLKKFLSAPPAVPDKPEPEPEPEPPEDEANMPAIYVYFKDNRNLHNPLPPQPSIMLNTTAVKPYQPRVCAYQLINGMGVWQSQAAMAIADYLNGGGKLNIIGSPSEPVGIIDQDAQGRPIVNGWFAGTHLHDGPLAGIKK